jgi:crossover junction endodeoxyribonuclease RuvC
MIIIGIDPGTAETGVGIIKKNSRQVIRIHHCCVKTSSKDEKSFRLYKIYNEISSLIKKYKAEALALESLFFNTNAKSASAVGQAIGAVLVAAGSHNIPVHQFSPLQIKKILTGYGRAEKKTLQNSVKKHLKIKEIPRPTHAADALAAAICLAFKNKNNESAKTKTKKTESGKKIKVKVKNKSKSIKRTKKKK